MGIMIMRNFKILLLITLLNITFIPRIFAEIDEDSESLQKSAIKNILKNVYIWEILEAKQRRYSMK